MAAKRLYADIHTWEKITKPNTVSFKTAARDCELICKVNKILNQIQDYKMATSSVCKKYQTKYGRKIQDGGLRLWSWQTIKKR
jgi:hypothetical protein